MLLKCSICSIPFTSDRRSKYCDICKEDLNRERQREQKKQLREEFLEAYGKKCSCPCGCVVSEPNYLGLAHIFNDGAKHRRRVGGGGYITYRDLRDLGWPKDKYRIECWNCNFSKRVFGKCPNEK